MGFIKNFFKKDNLPNKEDKEEKIYPEAEEITIKLIDPHKIIQNFFEFCDLERFDYLSKLLGRVISKGDIIDLGEEKEDSEEENEEYFGDNYLDNPSKMPKNIDNMTFKEMKKHMEKMLDNVDLGEENEEFKMMFKGDYFKIEITKTSPLGKVKVTKNTKINLTKIKIGEESFIEQEIINVSKIPDLKSCIKLKSLAELKKLTSRGYLINKFEDKKRKIYFIDKYYFEIPIKTNSSS